MELARAQFDGATSEPGGETLHYCSYCGTPLSALFYFCTACSTPYKHPETVLPGVAAPYVPDGKLIARHAPHAMRLFWTYFSVLVASSIVSSLTFDRGDMAGRLILGTVAVALTTCIMAAIYWRSLAVQLRQFGFASPAAWVGLGLLAPVLGVNYLYHEMFLRWLGGNVHSGGGPQWSQWGLIAIFCLFPAVSEELAFRGLLQHWLQAAVKPARAVVIASALFAAMHFSILSAPYLFAVGMLLGWTKWKTGSLYPSMLIHFLHNLAVIELMSPQG